MSEIEGIYFMLLLIQVIVVQWTKAAREEPLLGQRSAARDSFELPTPSLPQDALLFHRLIYRETSGFREPDESWESLPPTDTVQQGCVRLIERDAAAWDVTYEHTVSCGGLPARRENFQRASLMRGQWGRVFYQGRFPDRHQVLWQYYAHTLNIGWVVNLEPQLFLKTGPAWTIDDQTSLP